MSETTQNNADNQEIDLSQISKKIGGIFEGFSSAIFRKILFVKNNIIVIICLFILGIGTGYFLDKISRSYYNEVVVSSNYGSSDYLYSKIDLLQSKIEQGDTVFLKSIGIKNTKKLSKIEIEPIIDIYGFVNNNNAVNNAQNSQNFELVKLLSEDGDINKVIKDKITSKNYGRHNIEITTKGKISKSDIIQPIIAFLNNSNYYQNVKKVYLNNIKLKMKQNEGIIDQINALLDQFSSITSNNQKSNSLIYYNENTQLNEVIQTKNNLVAEIGQQKMELLNSDEVIKENCSIINVLDTNGLNGKMKFLVPFLFIFCFYFFNSFRNFYKKQAAKLSVK